MKTTPKTPIETPLRPQRENPPADPAGCESIQVEIEPRRVVGVNEVFDVRVRAGQARLMTQGLIVAEIEELPATVMRCLMRGVKYEATVLRVLKRMAVVDLAPV